MATEPRYQVAADPAPTGPSGRVLIGWSLLIAAGVATGFNAATPADRFHWWANFVLVPGVVIAALGMPLLTRRGGLALAGYAVSCLGALVTLVGGLLLAGAMSRGWPLLIAAPAAAVAGTYAWRPPHPVVRGLHRTVAGLAVVTMLLGLTFLALRLDALDFGDRHWWGAHLSLAGFVVGANGIELLRHRIEYRVQAATLLIGPALIMIMLGIRFLTGTALD